MLRSRAGLVLLAASAALALGLTGCGSGGTGAAAAATAPPAGSRTLTLQADHSYQPTAPPGGGTDDYHCTLLDPEVRTDSMIVSSHFFPDSPEVHHAILFLVPPDVAGEARAADGNGQGWTCFGESVLPGRGLAGLDKTPWLSAWAPGHGEDVVPKGTGISFPAGSLVVMQIHYNMLAGHAPVRARLVLQTVPTTPNRQPLKLSLLPAPPDVPCPAGVSGPLCDRNSSLADLGRRFGPELPRFVTLLESACGRDPQSPPSGDTTSCTWPLGFSGSIMRLTAHMHLLGKGMKIVLDPGTPSQQTLLDVTNFNFDYQRSYDIKPVTVSPTDRLQVTCTYNPELHQLLPELRRLPPRFVTWGDGSTDEMCLAIVSWTA
ncbi:MAG TPA: hypothetical protein VE990_09740 [Acidimicrobiales bacterium]|nr:hypothetical protein [Acidimicrobiales bacterium]